MKEESVRLSQSINAVIASLQLYYDIPEASTYDIKDTTNFLATFMKRAKENEQDEINKKYQAIMASPKADLWQNYPQCVQLPPETTRST